MVNINALWGGVCTTLKTLNGIIGVCLDIVERYSMIISLPYLIRDWCFVGYYGLLWVGVLYMYGSVKWCLNENRSSTDRKKKKKY